MGEHNLKAVAVEINICMFTDGRITVKAPLENKILCWGLLEAARNIVTQHKENASNIIIPDIAIPAGKPR